MAEPAEPSGLGAMFCQGGKTSSSMPRRWRMPVCCVRRDLLSKFFSISFSRALSTEPEPEFSVVLFSEVVFFSSVPPACSDGSPLAASPFDSFFDGDERLPFLVGLLFLVLDLVEEEEVDSLPSPAAAPLAWHLPPSASSPSSSSSSPISFLSSSSSSPPPSPSSSDLIFTPPSSPLPLLRPLAEAALAARHCLIC